MAYAQTSDVQARLGRDLTTAETAQATVLLEDAEILIKARIPDLDDQITDEAIDVNIVKMVEANAVVRVLRNPDGYVSETDGDYTYQMDRRLTTGALEILEHEWSLLGSSGGAFMIHLKVPTPFEGTTVYSDPTNPLFFYGPMFWNTL